MRNVKRFGVNWPVDDVSTPKRTLCKRRYTPEENGMFDQCCGTPVKDGYCKEHWFGTLEEFESLEQRIRELEGIVKLYRGF